MCGSVKQGTCDNQCGTVGKQWETKKPCYCDTTCLFNNDCCPDFRERCYTEYSDAVGIVDEEGMQVYLWQQSKIPNPGNYETYSTNPSAYPSGIAAVPTAQMPPYYPDIQGFYAPYADPFYPFMNQLAPYISPFSTAYSQYPVYQNVPNVGNNVRSSNDKKGDHDQKGDLVLDVPNIPTNVPLNVDEKEKRGRQRG